MQTRDIYPLSARFDIARRMHYHTVQDGLPHDHRYNTENKQPNNRGGAPGDR